MPRLTVKLDDQVMFDREVDECEGKDERGGHFSLTAEYTEDEQPSIPGRTLAELDAAVSVLRCEA